MSVRKQEDECHQHRDEESGRKASGETAHPQSHIGPQESDRSTTVLRSKFGDEPPHAKTGEGPQKCSTQSRATDLFSRRFMLNGPVINLLAGFAGERGEAKAAHFLNCVRPNEFATNVNAAVLFF